MARRGQVLIICMGLILLLVGLVGGFLLAAGTFSLNSGWEETDAQLLNLAEAGLHKAVWNLKTPAAGGGQGENWTTNGTTENLSNGGYTMVVAQWDFALAANGGSASAKSSNGANVSANAIDGNDATFWESGSTVTNSNDEYITVTFPYTLTLDKARFLIPASSNPNRPQNYQWQVSSDNVTYTTVKTVTNNTCNDRTDDFTATSNVNSLRLDVTRTNTNNRRARIATVEAIGSTITSTGSISSGGTLVTRTVVQTVVALDGSTAPSSTCANSTATGTAAAAFEPDWIEQ